MLKNFDEWNEQKKQIDSDRRNRPYTAGEIWWCTLGISIGAEHDGYGDIYQRPVLILLGLSPNTCLVAPLTTSQELHTYRVPIGNVAGKKASAILSQMRVIDTKRLLGKVSILDDATFTLVRKTAKEML